VKFGLNKYCSNNFIAKQSYEADDLSVVLGNAKPFVLISALLLFVVSLLPQP
jgi:hypothetical protein